MTLLVSLVKHGVSHPPVPFPFALPQLEPTLLCLLSPFPFPFGWLLLEIWSTSIGFAPESGSGSLRSSPTSIAWMTPRIAACRSRSRTAGHRRFSHHHADLHILVQSRPRQLLAHVQPCVPTSSMTPRTSSGPVPAATHTLQHCESSTACLWRQSRQQDVQRGVQGSEEHGHLVGARRDAHHFLRFSVQEELHVPLGRKREVVFVFELELVSVLHIAVVHSRLCHHTHALPSWRSRSRLYTRICNFRLAR